MTRFVTAGATLAFAVACGSAAPGGTRESTTARQPASDSLLSVRRIAALPDSIRGACTRYIDSSMAMQTLDRDSMARELRALGRPRPTRAPYLYFFVKNLPPDAIPYWDFKHPAIPNVERDASAAAIAASGLLDLARWTNGWRAGRYRRAATRMLAELATDYLSAGTASAAVLQHSVGQRPQNVEVDVGLIYADYYFVEAMLRSRGVFRD